MQYFTLKLPQTLELGNMRARVDPCGYNDFVKILGPGALEIYNPTITLVIMPHIAYSHAQTQPGAKVEILYVRLQILFYLCCVAMAWRALWKRKICVAALESMSIFHIGIVENG